MTWLKKFYQDILLPACLIFTILCLFFSVIIYALIASAGDIAMIVPTMSLNNLFQIFVFSLIFAWSNRLFSRKKTPFWLNLFCHFGIFLANLVIIFFVIGGHYTSARGAFVILVLFALIYIICAAVGVTIRHFIVASKPEENPYKRQFR